MASLYTKTQEILCLNEVAAVRMHDKAVQKQRTVFMQNRDWESSTDSISVCVCVFCLLSKYTGFVTTFRLTFQITTGNFKYYYCYGYGRYDYMLWLNTEILFARCFFGLCASVHHICDYYYRLRGILLMVPGCGAHIFNVLIRLMAFSVLCIYFYMRNPILHSFGID